MSAIRVVLRESGKGLAALRKATAEIRKAGSYVKVGVLAEGLGSNTHAVGKSGPEQGRAGAPTIAELAAIHEFGSRDGRIPERSFMRSTFNDNRAEYVEMLRKMLVQLVDQKTDVERILKTLGLRISTDMRKRISTGQVKPPNKLSTIRRKNRRLIARRKLKFDRPSGQWRTRKGKLVAIKTTPLIDTGQLVRAITYGVVIVKGTLLDSKAADVGDSLG